MEREGPGGLRPSMRSGCPELVSKNRVGVGGETASSPIFQVALFPRTLFLGFQRPCHWASPVTEEPPPKAGDIRDAGSIPGWQRSPGGRHSNPLQSSCLENLTDRGAWRTTVHGVTKSQTLLKWLRMHFANTTDNWYFKQHPKIK